MIVVGETQESVVETFLSDLALCKPPASPAMRLALWLCPASLNNILCAPFLREHRIVMEVEKCPMAIPCLAACAFMLEPAFSKQRMDALFPP
jgi:hypothetical protein